MSLNINLLKYLNMWKYLDNFSLKSTNFIKKNPKKGCMEMKFDWPSSWHWVGWEIWVAVSGSFRLFRVLGSNFSLVWCAKLGLIFWVSLTVKKPSFFYFDVISTFLQSWICIQPCFIEIFLCFQMMISNWIMTCSLH